MKICDIGAGSVIIFEKARGSVYILMRIWYDLSIRRVLMISSRYPRTVPIAQMDVLCVSEVIS